MPQFSALAFTPADINVQSVLLAITLVYRVASRKHNLTCTPHIGTSTF